MEYDLQLIRRIYHTTAKDTQTDHQADKCKFFHGSLLLLCV
jgi:hypothetical protein